MARARKGLAMVAALGVVGCTPVPAAPSISAPPLPASFQRGMNIEPIGGYGETLDLDRLPRSLDALVELGVDHVALIPSFFQGRLGDATFTWKGGRERIVEDTRRAVAIAHARGLRVLLKPHLWLEDRSDGAWRGDILPSAEVWPEWSRGYRDAVLQFARLADELGVAGISIGSELTELALARPRFWRRLAADVDAIFSGSVTYAANWDREFEAIDWWDAVDLVGVDAFWPLAESAEEVLGADDCRQRLGTIRDALAAVAARTERPVLVTEIGYKSARGAAWRPWEWHERQEADLPGQALIYACIADVLGPGAGNDEAPGWLAGAYVWIWYTDLSWGGRGNSDFTPRGKPAETVLARWFSAR